MDPDAQLYESLTTYLRRIVSTQGLAGIAKACKNILRAGDTVQIQICIIGVAGAGKSSFINAIRGLRASDDGAARVGITHTTMEIVKYTDPNCTNFVYCDVPGVGTPGYSKKTYMERVAIKTYEMFIFISSSRFTDDDLWLLKEIIQLKKSLYFVRTKVDVDVNSNMYDYGHSMEDTMEQIQRDCTSSLVQTGVEIPTTLFLINNHDVNQLDFPRLKRWLINDASVLRREILCSVMSLVAREVFKEKMEDLKTRNWGVAFLTSAGSLLPLVGILVDYTILMHETKKYKTEFGTDEQSLLTIAQHMEVSKEELITKYSIKSSVITMSATSFASFLAGAAVMTATHGAKLLIPIVGDLVSAVTSYPVSVYMQRKILTMCFEEALRMLDLFLERLRRD